MPPVGDDHRAREQAEALFRLTAAINEAEGLENVFEQALAAITALLGVERASILLYDEQGVMRFRAWRGLSPEYRRAVDGHSPWPRDAVSPRPILVPDVNADASLAGYRALFAAERIRSLGFVPLIHQARLLGKFMVYDAEPHTFTERDVRLAETVAGQIAQAVARTRLLADERAAREAAQRSRERTERLQAVTARLSRALLPADVAEVIIEEGSIAVRAWSGAIWALVDDRLEMLHQRGYPDPDAYRLLPLDASTPAGEAALTGEPVWLESREAFAARYAPLEERARRLSVHPQLAIAALPLRLGDRVIGAVGFTFEQPRLLDDADRQMLLALTEQGAQGLERARLYADERAARAQLARRALQQEALAQLGRIAVESADLEALLARVVETAATVLEVERATVLELSPAADELRLRAVTGGTPPHEQPTTIPNDPALMSGFALQQADLVWSNDLEQETRFRASPLFADRDARSGVAAPIPSRAGAFGVLGAHSTRPRAFTADDLQFVRGLVNVLGAALARADAERVTSEANRRKDEFLALLGHELRNPLAPILTALHLMRLRGETATERERQVIERQVVHLQRLVDDLLDVSRITRGKLALHTEPHELRGVVARAIEMASPLFEERAHKLVTDVPRQLWARLDPARFAQVIANLLTNAAKYTPAGGVVEVRGREEAGMAVVAVRDTGRGIPPEALPHLFQPFFQVERTVLAGHGGLGLGLALVRSLVDLHGGSVEVESLGADAGSCFTVRVPAAPAQQPASEVAAPVVRPTIDPARRRRVLVVDDIHDVADGTAELLRLHGHEVAVAYDGPQALLRAAVFAYDVALLDLGLPVMDGYELAGLLRREGHAGHLVAVTGYGQESDRARTLAAGFDEHLTKPVTPKRLLAVVEGQPRRALGTTPPSPPLTTGS
jgi:signal transduction histidine kinase/ActR/RegA family two-component response regulator